MTAIAIKRRTGRATARDGRNLRALRRFVGGALGIWLTLIVVTVAVAHGPRLFGAESVAVRGSSMEPGILVGSAVIVVDDDPYAGDVITFSAANGVWVTHRIVGIVSVDGEDHYLTQGDANEAPDPNPVHPDAVVGKAVLAIPLVGYAMWLISQPAGMLGVVTGALALLLLSWLLDDIEAQRRERARLLDGRI